MKIMLIQPAQLDNFGNPIKYKFGIMPSGTLANIAALTPNNIDISVIDESIDTINYDEDVDLIGISSLTCQAPRAYQIAKEFKKRNKTVIMGGVHATILPQEVLNHVDSVVIGEAENIWPKVISDFQKNKKLKTTYKNKVLPDLQKLLIPRFELTNYNKCIKPLFSKTPAIPIFTTRGCPFNCSFCSVKKLLGNAFRTKPVENVLKEIEASKAKSFFFTDDNIMGDEKHAEQLFKTITPLKIRWMSQFSTHVLHKPKLVELAGKSGCYEVILGIESINSDNLKNINKQFNKPDEYKNLFKLLKDNDINPHVQILFGMDNDTEEVFKRTIEFLLENDVNFIHISIITPFPGTDLYKQLEKEKRIFTKDWSKYDITKVVFHPKNITIEQLENAVRDGHKQFYSYGNIMRRIWKFRKFYYTPNNGCSLLDDLLFQLHFNICVKKGIDPYSGVI